MTQSVQTLLRWLHDDGFSPEVSGPAADGVGAAADIGNDPAISSLCIDSRAVTRGSLFAALPGHQVDGHSFITRALEAGASCVLAQRPPQDNEKAALSGCWITLEDSPRALARLAARFYGLLPARLIGITGTNGKTSVAHFTRLLLDPARTASIGTLGLRPEGLFALPGLTSPDALSLAQALGAAAGAGMDHAVLEASSHGLEQGRLAGLDFTAAGFTHLSRDHLDYHGTMDAYWQAKRTLFTRHLTPGARVVIDERLPQTQELAALGLDLFRLGALGSETADLAYAARPRSGGLALQLAWKGEQAKDFDLPLFGTFQAENIAVAMGLARVGGADVASEALSARLAGLAQGGTTLGVPGRMMPVTHHPKAPHGRVLVDYAHTPDALATALQAARPHCEGRLLVVFGAGGDRDPGKRVLMGEAAAQFADWSLITDDNPRSEDPAAIRAAVRRGAPEALEVGDRADAIATALAAMAPDDLLLIAGKGHETGQVVGATTLPFDDAEQTRQAAAALWGSSPNGGAGS